MLMVGISAGETREGQAGATYRRVRLAVSEDGTAVTIGDRRVAVTPQTFALFFKSGAGTYHGVYSPVDLRTARARDCAPLRAGEGFRGVEETSCSGGADIAALVLVVDRPLAIVTSGYRGRSGWSYMLLAPTDDGGFVAESVAPQEYRARFAPAETL